MCADTTDVLVVGAGPTGLTLAAGLTAFGARFRIVDRRPDRASESRALAIQPRTLEVPYPRTFVLADLDAEGLAPGAVHAHLSPSGCCSSSRWATRHRGG